MEQRASATEAQRGLWGSHEGLPRRRHWDETVVFIPGLRKLARVASVFCQAHSRKIYL